jgi:acetyl-CoA acetyltransferase
MTLDELMKRSKVDKTHVEDVITGCVTPMGEQGKLF